MASAGFSHSRQRGSRANGNRHGHERRQHFHWSWGRRARPASWPNDWRRRRQQAAPWQRVWNSSRVPADLGMAGSARANRSSISAGDNYTIQTTGETLPSRSSPSPSAEAAATARFAIAASGGSVFSAALGVAGNGGAGGGGGTVEVTPVNLEHERCVRRHPRAIDRRRRRQRRVRGRRSVSLGASIGQRRRFGRFRGGASTSPFKPEH